MPHGVPAQKTYLFNDLRHILCSDLQWLDQEGRPLPLHPQGPRIEPVASASQMPRGIRLRTHPGTKTGPVPKTPWPRSRIIYDGGVYRAWGIPTTDAEAPPAPGHFRVCYSESNDMFDWRHVHTASVPLPGGPLIGGVVDGFTVFIDPRASANERYKAVYCSEPPREQWPEILAEYERVNRHHRIWRLGENFVFAVYGLTSPDGLEWKPLPKHLMAQFSDTDTTVYFDEVLGHYVMYSRLMFQQRRWIGRADSEDFQNWSPLQPIMGPSLDGSFTDDIYQNGFSFYPGEPAYYLMFPMIYHRWNQRSSIQMYSSEDGLAWLKVPGPPLIECGQPGAFDSEFLAVGKDLVPMAGDRVALPYMGTRYPHKYPRWPEVLEAPTYAWAWWQRGRISSLRADTEGSFVTFPLEVAGRALRLNARIDRGGEIRVGIVGQAGRTVADCGPITGDGLDLPVHWHGRDEVALPNGEPITLEFKLRSADLFGFHWVD